VFIHLTAITGNGSIKPSFYKTLPRDLMRKRCRTAISPNLWFDESKFNIVLLQQVKQTLSMKIGYARVSTRDQKSDLQVDALKAAGCERVYQDVASGAKTARPALDELLGQLRAGDVLVIWKLDRMGRSLKHLVELVGSLMERKVGLLSLNDPIDTTSAQGRLVFNLFASLAEFERDLIRERTMAGLAAARARGRKGGRKFALSKAQVRLAQAAMAQRDTSVSDLCKELGIERVTLYRYVGPKGELRDYGKRVLGLA